MVPGQPLCPCSRQRLLDICILVLSLLLFASSLGHVPQHDLQWRQVAQDLHENNNALLSGLSRLSPAPPAPPQLEHVDVCLQGSCSNQVLLILLVFEFTKAPGDVRTSGDEHQALLSRAQAGLAPSDAWCELLLLTPRTSCPSTQTRLILLV